jgi:hypothetical protein
MLLEIEKPYTDMMQKIIDYGFANNFDEAIKQSIISYTNQINFEELYLVDKAVNIEMNEIEKNNLKLISYDEVLNN